MNRDGQARSCHSYTRPLQATTCLPCNAAPLLFPSHSYKVRLCPRVKLCSGEAACPSRVETGVLNCRWFRPTGLSGSAPMPLPAHPLATPMFLPFPLTSLATTPLQFCCYSLLTLYAPPCHPQFSRKPVASTPRFSLATKLSRAPCMCKMALSQELHIIRTPAHSHATPVRIAQGFSWDYRRVEANISG